MNCPEPADALFLRCEWLLDVVKPKRLGACGKPQRVRIIGHERRVARLRLSFHIVQRLYLGGGLMLRARVPAFQGSGERHVPEQWLSDAGDTGAIKKLRHVWGLVVNCAIYAT